MEAFIESLLDRLLATSMQAAVLAALVWLLCRYVPRLSPATQCWLWWLVALHAVLGLFLEPVHLNWLQSEPAITTALVQSLPSGNVDTAMVSDTGPGLPLWQAGLLLLWAGGVALAGGWTLRNWLRAREVLKSSARCTDEQLLRTVAQTAAARGMRGAPRVRMSALVDSPMIIGQLRPVLLLPAHAALSRSELEMAVEHELEHLRRGDLRWGLIPAVARHAFFFHPLVHLAVREYGIAREAACDAAVVNAAHRCRRDYGQLLVRLGAASESSTGLAAVSPTFRSLRRRLILLQHTSFVPRAGSIAVLVLAIAGVVPVRLGTAAENPAAPATQAAPVVQIAGPGGQMSPPPGALPSLVFMPDPADHYPSASIGAGEEGRVRLRLCYDDRGRVTSSSVAGSSGFARLDEAAMQMGHRFEFQPGLADGIPQGSCIMQTVRFSVLGNEAAATPGGQVPAQTPAPDATATEHPRVLHRPDLVTHYPADSLASGEAGTVRIRICYSEQGRVTESTVAESSGFARLDAAAVRLGSMYRVRPGMTGGIPQAGCLVVPVRFSPTNQSR